MKTIHNSYPVSLSEYGRRRKCTAKSDFLKCLEDLADSSFEPTEVNTKVVDGAAFVNMNQPKTSKTFGDYCSHEMVKKVQRIARGTSRLDFVFDTYKATALKRKQERIEGKVFELQ